MEIATFIVKALFIAGLLITSAIGTLVMYEQVFYHRNISAKILFGLLSCLIVSIYCVWWFLTI